MKRFVVEALAALRVPVRATGIETFEVSKADVLASVRSPATKGAGGAKNLMMPKFDAASGFTGKCVVAPAGKPLPLRQLPFTSWELFHAAKKSELTQYTARSAQKAAVGMSLEYTPMFWWKQNLGLLPGGVDSRKDAARTNLASRVGEGLGHLLMQKRFGFRYWDHLPSLFLRLAIANAATHPEMLRKAHAKKKAPVGKDEQEPDFVFENKAEVALAECKGHFVRADQKTVPFGGELRAALAQLDGWPARISPTPKRTFATNAVIAERGGAMPSFLCFTDPEERGRGDAAIPLDDDVRRGNYGAWLLAMGLNDEAEALRWRDTWAPSGRQLVVVPIGGRKFVVAPPMVLDGLSFWAQEEYCLWRHGELPAVVAGLDLVAMQAVKRALQGDTLNDVDLPGEFAGDPGFSGSVLADGTLLGMVRLRDRQLEVFEL